MGKNMKRVKKYKVMGGSSMDKIADFIEKYEKEGWSFHSLLSQPVTIKNDIVKGMNDQQSTTFMGFYPLMFKFVEVKA